MKAIILGVVGAVVGCLLGIAMVWADGMPPQASEQAITTDRLYAVMLISTSGIFGLVTAVLIFAVVKFRARRGDMRDAPPIHGHTGLEVVWTVIPAVIVIALTALSWIALDDNNVASAKGHMRITVWGQKWDWTYDYPDAGLHDQHKLVVPINTDIRFEVQSRDVIHGWWVPDWRIQMNATPGQTNVISATPNRLGEFAVVCTFICGDAHPKMGTEVEGHFPVRIEVMSAENYAAWLADAQAKQKEADANPNAKAVAIFNANGCGACHAWKPAASAGNVGPSLDNLAADAQKAGMPVEAYVKDSIIKPSAYLVLGFPDGVMGKDFGQKISDADLAELVKRLVGGTP